MSTAVVLGGGVSGLASAYYIAKAANNKFSKIILLEASDRLGGWIHSTRNSDGSLFEHGPRSLRISGDESAQNTIKLASSLRLHNRAVGVDQNSSAAKNRFIYVNNKLHMLPTNKGFRKVLFQTHPPFSQPFYKFVWRDLRAPPSELEDEDIHSFFSRRFGQEISEYLINPVCRGIYAGDIKKLSVKSCFRALFDAEKRGGSVVTGMFFNRGPSDDFNIHKLVDDLKDDFVKKSANWVMWSLQNGLEELVYAMEDSITDSGIVQIETESPCKQLTFENGKAKVVTDNGVFEADEVISSIYAKDLGNLLTPENKELSNELQGIPAATCAVVNFQFSGKPKTEQGFGHLLPSSEDGPTLGVIYDSCAFSGHDGSNPDTYRLTVMLGGSWYEELVDRLGGSTDDDKFIDFARDALRKQLNITDVPSKVDVKLQKDCIPHYVVGHRARLNRIYNFIDNHDLPLTLVGSSYEGVSVNDCIYKAKCAVEDLLSDEVVDVYRTEDS